MDKNKQAALAKALEQIKLGVTHRQPVRVMMRGTSELAPEGLKSELEAIIGREVDVVWRQITKRDIPRTNAGEITDGEPPKVRNYEDASRYYEDAARRGARTGD